MNIFIIIAAVAVIIGFILQTLDYTWTRFKPGWASFVLLAFFLFLRYLGVV